MATLGRVRVIWSGTGVVGGGLSTFYSSNSDPSAFADALHDFFTAANGLFPDTVFLQVQSAGETIDEASGDINGVWSGGALAAIQGAGPPDFALGVGARVVWQTAGITRGRRVRGSTFLVPLSASVYTDDGTLDNTNVTNLQDAAEDLRTADSGSMRIYSRPLPGQNTGGSASGVTAAIVPDKISWLRSRRT